MRGRMSRRWTDPSSPLPSLQVCRQRKRLAGLLSCLFPLTVHKGTSQTRDIHPYIPISSRKNFSLFFWLSKGTQRARTERFVGSQHSASAHHFHLLGSYIVHHKAHRRVANGTVDGMGDRETFLRMMGISNEDIASPDDLSTSSTTRPRLSGGEGGKQTSVMSSINSNSSVGLSSGSESLNLGGSSGGGRLPHRSPIGAPAVKKRAFLAELGLDENGDSISKSHYPLLASESPSVHRGATAKMVPVVCTDGFRTPAEFKGAGNTAFERGAFLEAIKHYTQAIDLAEAASVRQSGDEADRVLLAALHSNRSASYLQAAKQFSSVESAYEHALNDADRAVELRPEWFKGYARQGDAYFKAQRYRQATESFELALHLQPGNATLSRSLQEAKDRAKADSHEWQTRRNTRKQQSSSGANSTGSSFALNATLGSTSQLGSTARSMDSNGDVRGSRVSQSPNSRAMWEELKEAADVPLGDAYRRQQLEKYRQEREENAKRLFGANPPAATDAKGPTPLSASSSAGGTPSQDIPYEFSSSAASAYQQRLLEEYRRKKAVNKR